LKRKHFISSALVAFSSLQAFAQDNVVAAPDSGPVKTPPYLHPGDIIGIASPAGYISTEDCLDAVNTLQAWGFKVKMGGSVGQRDYSLGGTDAQRLTDLQNLLDDDAVKAIMCARGGYGLARIIDNINFKKFVQHPKWIIGFSDATVMHSHINKNFGIATLHSKMCNSFVAPDKAEPIQTETLDSIRRSLIGEKINYPIPINAMNRKGSVTGKLVGGNLKTLETLIGTNSEPDTKNKLLFLEDTGEYMYSLDRMFLQLKRAGMLEQLAGLMIGGFKIKKDDEGEEFGRTLEQVVMEKVSGYNYPVCFDFPVGHQKNNFALKCGVLHELNVQENAVSLKEK
jgi:muramoyltetrapeptide carboxypeptidase